MTTPKWVQKMIDQGVSPEVISARIERRKVMDREWAARNRDKKRQHKSAYQKRVKKADGSSLSQDYKSAVIPSAYRPDWRLTPAYSCPELTYRGRA